MSVLLAEGSIFAGGGTMILVLYVVIIVGIEI